MKKIKRAYYYFFYKIYKAAKYTSYPFGDFLLDYRALIGVVILEAWIYISLLIYLSFINKLPGELTILSPLVYIPAISIFVINYIAFIHTDIWKQYNKEFDNLSKKQNRIGTWIVLGIVLAIIGNLILSVYCLDLKARRNQTGPYNPVFIAKERLKDSLQRAKQIENLKKIYGEKDAK
ncbi:hypothetical protein ACFO4P_12095 [Epilithonimonas pallida]|uniref:Uncharacterized protein n=1 Tax=Epilithonimonas pallida TaxID=373671 RepID=A0ABY1R6F4_9FLAO|nr:hypothetical protein [Epilithonimonas pallida]SMP97242.1 hypothetical protein SAMN05421679_1124 [Epilithonimonas pallida]